MIPAISRISLVLLFILFPIGLKTKTQKSVRLTYNVAIVVYVVFCCCAIMIHPLVGVVNASIFIALYLLFRFDGDFLGRFTGAFIYGIALLWGFSMIVSIGESLVGHPLF